MGDLELVHHERQNPSLAYGPPRRRRRRDSGRQLDFEQAEDELDGSRSLALPGWESLLEASVLVARSMASSSDG
jgi:hypothetical protein